MRIYYQILLSWVSCVNLKTYQILIESSRRMFPVAYQFGNNMSKFQPINSKRLCMGAFLSVLRKSRSWLVNELLIPMILQHSTGYTLSTYKVYSRPTLWAGCLHSLIHFPNDISNSEGKGLGEMGCFHHSQYCLQITNNMKNGLCEM